MGRTSTHKDTNIPQRAAVARQGALCGMGPQPFIVGNIAAPRLAPKGSDNKQKLLVCRHGEGC